ncbi:MAG: pyridoxal phosphate enzyme (YggS family) [Planctomycetota bacterium]
MTCCANPDRVSIGCDPLTQPISRSIQNLRLVRARIEAAPQPGGQPVALLAVTKSVPNDVARELALAGQRDLAENRVEVFESKVGALSDLDVRWHFIGHIQRNKARRIVALATVVHSVDSLRLLHTLERMAAELGRELEIFLQVNATGEEQKHGLPPAQVPEAVAALDACPHLKLLGLMAMGPTGADPLETRRAFEATATLARKIEDDPALAPRLAAGRCQLSMGMSADLELAIAAGSNLVRVGRALFQSLPGEALNDPAPGLD